MKIATLLFTYHRSYHTKQVLTGLKQNSVLPRKLLVFQDGLREGDDECEWKKVSGLIHDIDWCDREIIISETNKGLAESIVSGINYAFENYDAVIVLEDDCVPMPNFMKFMEQCFEKYQDDARVYSISGYAYPIILEKDEFDVYACGRVSSWGWGTWKSRWQIYQKDYEILKQFRKDREKSARLAVWGRDLEAMLVGNIRGTIDSWAVFWALQVILRNGICINPYLSLIDNIGCDGTGVNCGATDSFKTQLDVMDREFVLPDSMIFKKSIKMAFAECFGSYTAVSEQDADKVSVIVYGIGDYYVRHEKQINRNYYIIRFADTYRRGYFEGKEVIPPNEIDNNGEEKILIMIQNAQICVDIAHMLIDQGVDRKKIIVGVGLYDNHRGIFDDIEIAGNGQLRLIG